MTASVMFTLRSFSVPACVPQKPGVRQIASLQEAGSGTSGVWLQSVGPGPVHSSCVQTSLSSQLGGVEWLHSVGEMHVSVVQTLLSSQFGGVECVHWPGLGPVQASVVQTFPSSQGGGVEWLHSVGEMH